MNCYPLEVQTRHAMTVHDDVIKWKHFPRYWPFVRGIHRSPVNSPHKGQWHGALMFSLICARINGGVNNREAGDLRRHQAHCDVIVMGFYLTHWRRDKMTAIFQTAFSIAFSWVKIVVFWWKFHWNLFPWIQLTIFQHWVRWWLGAGQATSHYLNRWCI